MKFKISAILTIVCFFWAGNVFAFLGTSRFEKEVEKEKGALKLFDEVQRGGYGLIGTEDLKKLIDSNENIVIVDTMPYEASYKKAHVPGARQFLFPIPDMEKWDTEKTDGKTEADYKALLGDDLNRKIVVYCGFVKCTRSHNGAVWARKLGYRNVLRYPGGIYAWKGADYKVDQVK